MNIGIDPGYSGAVAFMDEQAVKAVLDLPVLTLGKRQKTPPNRDPEGKAVRLRPSIKRLLDLEALRTMLIEQTGGSCGVAVPTVHVFIERSQPTPKQEAMGAGHYMLGYGQIIGLLVGLFIPYTEVTPQVWKKAMMAGMSKGKNESCIRANQLFPSLGLSKKQRNRAAAVLICEYGRRLGL